MKTSSTPGARRHRTMSSGVVILAATAVMSLTAPSGARAEGTHTLARDATHTPSAAHTANTAVETLDPPFLAHSGNTVGRWAFDGGVAVMVPRYMAMETGDHIALSWGPIENTVWHNVTAAEAAGTQSVLVHVSERVVQGAGDSRDLPVRYRLDRVGSGQTELSAVAHLLVKTTRPGGWDPNPLTPHNDNLARPEPPARVTRYGVNAELAAQGVPVTIAAYPYMSADDVIELYWDGIQLTHLVGADEVGQPVTVTVPKETIAEAGDGDLTIAYRVHDVADNRSDWAETVPVRVYLEAGNRKYLAAPVVPPEVTGVPLLGVPVRIPVHQSSGIEAGDTVHLWWGSIEVRHTVQPQEVQNRLITVNVGLVTVLAAGYGDLQVSYGLRNSSGAGAAGSPETPVRVRLL
ncbi:hypothetical protein ACIQVA_39015 [Streptomyces microflavus]|uniref:hypothetical protein n=1 Tax=Streptomyces microflavus TaxID=1919 RepID=UPI0038252784